MSNQADEQEWWQDADGSFMHPREGQLTVEYLNDLHTAARVGRDCLHVSAQPLFETNEYGFAERTSFTWCLTCGSLLDKSGKWRQPSAMSPTTGGKE